jgi:hypothetical protein
MPSQTAMLGVLFSGAAPNLSSEITDIAGYRFTPQEWARSGERAQPSKDQGRRGGVVSIQSTFTFPSARR